MSSNLYLPRKMSSNDVDYTEDELLITSKYVVVLAEPGGGKTELMRSLAKKLGTYSVTANKFKRIGSDAYNCPLVIDAFDELAKIDQTGIHDLLANASKAKPTHLIISSRSSEWGIAATTAFEEYLECSPLLVRLVEFEENEQQEIFKHHVQSEDFGAFQAEVARFELGMLLPNPQFLKMFADAYIESGRHFTDKRSIFSQAVERLAKEANATLAKTSHALTIAQKVGLSSEVFAKLLLSGADGIGTSEAIADRIYPLLGSLFENTTAAEGILATRLFKPGDSEDQHRSVHKIVAEYCAADYLAKRIADPTDHLTIHKCLPVIAPNATVRDELRGLLGWLAALGNKSIQELAIELDPYAVLANGDPSQLEQSSKRLLIERLQAAETRDPYFRRGDSWRRFSAVGFFTKDVINEIKPLLASGNDGQLRDLILELLAGSPATAYLTNELRQLVLDSNQSKNSRLLASRCLSEVIEYDHPSDMMVLFSEASDSSLSVVANTITTVGPEKFDTSLLAIFLSICARIYPAAEEDIERAVDTRYFTKKFVSSLNVSLTVLLLDELSRAVVCTCGKERYACHCRDGICRIIGLLLDRYFELASTPFDPEQVWRWLENLNFHYQRDASSSTSVKVLKTNDDLRQGIMACVFGKITDREEIFKIKTENFDTYAHSGLKFQNKDYDFIVDLAFELENSALWASFMAAHHRYRDRTEASSNHLRRHMREQALEKPQFMIEWARSNRACTKLSKYFRLPRTNRKAKRRQEQRNERREATIQYYQSNRALIESGCVWKCLVQFADLTLINPERIEEIVCDAPLVHAALKNSIGFIAPRIPDLLRLSQLRCAGKALLEERVLLAACLEVMRAEGCLESIELRLLIALRISVDRSYSSVSKEEHDALKTELDRLVFADPSSAERYLRQYLEPQLAQKECCRPNIWLLAGDQAFSHLRAQLSIEWLERFPDLGKDALYRIFEIAAQFGDRSSLQVLIEDRCKKIMSDWPAPTADEGIERKRIFWLVRAFYFMPRICDTYWDWLKADRNTIFALDVRSQRFNLGESSYWPMLTALKVESILDAFIDEWPKVYLPSHWGTGSPSGEAAYRFLTDLAWVIHSDNTGEAIPVLNRLLDDPRFVDMHNDFKSVLATKLRQQALKDFEPPSPREIVELLDRNAIVNVEGLRKLVLQEFEDFQKAISGGEFNPADRFYDGGKRLGEVKSTEIIAERLSLRLEAQGIVITSEHQMKSENRTDFTVTKVIGGKRRLVVVEVKGQWHKELYSAAFAQLSGKYSIHPDADGQGIYLVIWFGGGELVANKKNTTLNSASELKSSIEDRLPPELVGLIDVFVLDVSGR